MQTIIILILSNQLLHRVRVMVFNTTFNNISVISWWSVLLLEETGENHWPVASNWQTLSHIVVSSISRHEWDSNSQLHWWWALIAQVVVNPTTIWSWSRRHALPPPLPSIVYSVRQISNSIQYSDIPIGIHIQK